MRLKWQHDENTGQAWATVRNPEGSLDEYEVFYTSKRAEPYRWYWCAGHGQNLDDAVAGAEETKAAAMRYCARVAAWRHGWPAPHVRAYDAYENEDGVCIIPREVASEGAATA